MPQFRELKQGYFTGERALYNEKNLAVYDSVFADGESPLKECADIELYNSMFKWKYPLWYCHDIKMEDCTLFEMARAGIWYTDNITVKNTIIEAPKNFRRCNSVKLKDVNFPNASETFWNCSDIDFENVSAKGDYFAMNCRNAAINNFRLAGNYSFDGAENIEIRNSRLLSKDAFWNSRNVTVYDSLIAGEYLGWNAKNLTLVNCTIESLQGLCYIEDLVIKNCKLINTNLAFEYSTIDAEVTSRIDSVKNPRSGRLKAAGIGELILEKDKIDPDKTEIIINENT